MSNDLYMLICSYTSPSMLICLSNQPLASVGSCDQCKGTVPKVRGGGEGGASWPVVERHRQSMHMGTAMGSCGGRWPGWWGEQLSKLQRLHQCRSTAVQRPEEASIASFELAIRE